MAHGVWFQSLFLNPPRICGRDLKPFSLGHEFLLRNLGSPLICGGECRKEDLFAAILICSMTFEQCQEIILYRPRLLKWFLWSLRWWRADFALACANFRQYVDEYTDTPGHWHKTDEKADTFIYAAPWELHIVRVLCREYNCKLTEAWNMPVSLARCLYDTWAEARGDTSLVSESQQEVIDRIEREKAAEKKESA